MPPGNCASLPTATLHGLEAISLFIGLLKSGTLPPGASVSYHLVSSLFEPPSRYNTQLFKAGVFRLQVQVLFQPPLRCLRVWTLAIM